MSKINIPQSGKPHKEIIAEISSYKSEDAAWNKGRTFSLIYNPGEEVIKVAHEAYSTYFIENALSPMAFPSLKKFETEAISMAAGLLGGDDKVVGNMTSGGTESIFMAVKTTRDYYRAKKPDITAPEIVMPNTAHPAFDKAAHYLNMKVIHVPVNKEFRADVDAMRKAVTPNTVMMVGSAMTYPHGMVDPIKELSDFAGEKGIWFHTDSCLGGFILPFVKMLGYDIPDFDFSNPGVTSMSADLHKYAYCAKPASTVLYRDKKYRHYMFFSYSDWPGGAYGTPTLTGARPGGSVAAAWAVLNHLGIDGYKALAKDAIESVRKLIKEINSIDGLYVLGNPDATVFAFSSDKINVFELAEQMKARNWHLECQHLPPSIHITTSPYHKNVIDEFIADLKDAVSNTSEIGTKDISQTAAMYGMLATLPDRKAANEMTKSYLNDLYKV